MSRTVSQPKPAANRTKAAKSIDPRIAAVLEAFGREDLQELARIKEELIALYRPVDLVDRFAIDNAAHARQSMLRAARLEAGLLAVGLGATGDSAQPGGDGDHESTPAQKVNGRLAKGFQRLVGESNSWKLLLRYQTNSELRYRRAIKQLEWLKALREKSKKAAAAGTPEPSRQVNGPHTETAPAKRPSDPVEFPPWTGTGYIQ